jgi:hypothetical protein
LFLNVEDKFACLNIELGDLERILPQAHQRINQANQQITKAHHQKLTARKS